MNSLRTAFVTISIIGSLTGCSHFPAASHGHWQGFSESGKASFYADKHQHRKTANGEIYRHDRKTAAHKTLPFGTRIKVVNVNNGKSVVVTINDRGPFVRGRIVDLSRSAFSTIANPRQGVVEVKLRVVD